MDKVIATYVFSNNSGLRLTEIENGINDRVCYLDMQNNKHRVKIYYTSTGRAYFKYGARRIYLDECMRVNN